MEIKRNIPRDLKRRYQIILQVCLIISLLLCIIIFQAFKKFERVAVERELSLSPIEVDAIPPTSNEKPPPPPSRPAVPIESESDEIPPDVTIEDTDLRLDELPEPPSEPVVEQQDEFVFIPYDEPPKPMGGFLAIQRNLVYPEIARKAGIEGAVIVQAKISETGKVIDTRIMVPLGNSGCNEAAVAAIKSVRWEPAKQRDKPVAVWISIPIRFRLK